MKSLPSKSTWYKFSVRNATKVIIEDKIANKNQNLI